MLRCLHKSAPRATRKLGCPFVHAREGADHEERVRARAHSVIREPLCCPHGAHRCILPIQGRHFVANSSFFFGRQQRESLREELSQVRVELLSEDCVESVVEVRVALVTSEGTAAPCKQRLDLRIGHHRRAARLCCDPSRLVHACGRFAV